MLNLKIQSQKPFNRVKSLLSSIPVKHSYHIEGNEFNIKQVSLPQD